MKIAAPSIVQAIINGMQDMIALYKMELMQRYPNVLLVHDKAVLERIAVPGAKIAWMVGHSHTHIVPLGFHTEEGNNVQYLINLGSEDRFFVINVGQGEKFTMTEVNRKEFASLNVTPAPYERKGSVSDFWLFNKKTKIGYISLKYVGTTQQKTVSATITPMSGISAHEKAALEIWCNKAISEMAGSLFVQYELTWCEPIQIAEAA